MVYIQKFTYTHNIYTHTHTYAHTYRPGANGAHHALLPGQISMGAKLFPMVYRTRRIFVSMNKLIPTIFNLIVSMATAFLLI